MKREISFTQLAIIILTFAIISATSFCEGVKQSAQDNEPDLRIPSTIKVVKNLDEK